MWSITRFNFDQLESMDEDSWITFECRFCNEENAAAGEDDVTESLGNESSAQIVQRYVQNIKVG